MAGSDWDMFSCDKNQYMQPVISCWVGEAGMEKQVTDEKTKTAKRVPVIQIQNSSQKSNYPVAPNHEYSTEFESVLAKQPDDKIASSDSNIEFSLDVPTEV